MLVAYRLNILSSRYIRRDEMDMKINCPIQHGLVGHLHVLCDDGLEYFVWSVHAQNVNIS